MSQAGEDYGRSPAAVGAAEHDPDLNAKRVAIEGVDDLGDPYYAGVTPDGELMVTGTFSGTVAGVATEAEQQAQTVHLAAIEAAVENTLTVTGTVTAAPALVGTAITTSTEVSVGGADTTLLAANGDRKRAFIQNHGDGNVRVDLSATATATSPIRLVPRVGTFELLPSASGHMYLGEISAFAESGTNAVGVIEEE